MRRYSERTIRGRDVQTGHVLLERDKPPRRVQSVIARPDGLLDVTSAGAGQGQYNEVIAPDDAVTVRA